MDAREAWEEEGRLEGAEYILIEQISKKMKKGKRLEIIVRELETDIYHYAFYGADSVWMLQYREDKGFPAEENGRAEEENGRAGSLFIFENGEKQRITNQAVWVVKAGSGEGSRSASWVLE